MTDDTIDSDNTSDDDTTTASETSTSGSAGAPSVEVKCRIFIPSPALTAPGVTGTRAFAGDGRDFDYSAGTSRAEIVGTVTLAVPGQKGSVALGSRSFGLTDEYNPDDILDVPGKPDWWKDLKAGASATASDTQTTIDDHLNIVSGAPGSTAEQAFNIAWPANVTAAITVDGKNPLVTVAPAIDADLYVHFKIDNGRVMGVVHGSHDGFPAYEIYFNQILAYKFDPVAAGTSPMNLFPPEDITVNTNPVDIGPA